MPAMVPNQSTRREFLRSVAAGGAIAALNPVSGRADTPAGARGWTAAQVEIRRRAQQYIGQRRLVVDYYRIGRRLAFPLPLASLSIPEVVVPGIPKYPWATWLTWTLEERILSLGWAAEWFRDEAARKAAAADLAALAGWPEYRQYDGPDLSSAHAGRILWTAATRWAWVEGDLRQKVLDACRRHAESVVPQSDRLFGAVVNREQVLTGNASALLHNIPLIGTAGAALTAAAAGHSAAGRLNSRLLTLFGALLDLRSQGFCEAVAYDGYVLDFIADWLATLAEDRRRPILDHPRMADYLEQSYVLGAPGAAEQVAELGDVEPREMPFHLSAQAKLLRLQANPVRRWLLSRCRLDWIRADGLAALTADSPALSVRAPRAGALDAHYALVLRSGWEPRDLAVAASCSQSAMGHLHNDAGSLVIGTQGDWLITDPGYQQYAKGDQRDFTTGPAAHNAPIINGLAQSRRGARRVRLEETAPGLSRMGIELTACYPASLELRRLVRHIWLSGNQLVVVADQFEAVSPLSLKYHWHGHPRAAWWLADGSALLGLGDSALWIVCPQGRLEGPDLQRLPGSRGQLSIVSTIGRAPGVFWWVFALGHQRPRIQVLAGGLQLQVDARTFDV